MFSQAKVNSWRAKFTPSRLFIYYNERAMEGTIPFDSGAMIRDGIKSLAKQGVCSENTWPYIINRFRLLPSKFAYSEGLTHTAIQYSRVGQTVDQLKACLASGYPFVFGFAVYDGFESGSVAKTGILNMPTKGEKMRGGHAVLCVGYSDETKRFIVQNSWGQNWGDKGFFTMPYEYITNNDLADDFWVVQVVK
jgi:C1A family cysteine protease